MSRAGWRAAALRGVLAGLSCIGCGAEQAGTLRQPIKGGTLAPERLDDHRRMARELDALEARRDPRLASERRKQWRSLTRSMRLRDRLE